MPAGHDVVFDDLVQAQHLVHRRLRELGGVDGLALQRLVDLAARHHGHRGAELFQHLAADAGEADAQAVEVVQLLDGLGEPAGAFRADNAAQHRVDVALGVDLLQQLLAVTLVVPGQVRRRLHVERRAGVQRQGRNGALVVADPGVAGRVLAAAHRIHDLERRHQLARLVVAQLDVAARDGLERFGKMLDRGGEADQVRGEGQRHLPADLFRGAGDATEQAGAEQGGGTDGAGDTGEFVLGRHAGFLLVVVLVPEGGRVTARGSRALTGQNKNRGRAVLPIRRQSCSLVCSGVAGWIAGSVPILWGRPKSGDRLWCGCGVRMRRWAEGAILR